MKLIADVDTGIDDAVALAWLCSRPEVELLAVSTSAGNTTAELAAYNTLSVLEACGRADVPVVIGRTEPLQVPLVTTPETHGSTGLGYATVQPHRAPTDRDFCELWLELVRDHPGEITLLVTGPCTNLASALRREPRLPELLERVVIMGGAFNHPGNTTPTAEWNTWVDPHAAAEVVAAWQGRALDRLPIVCALETTERIILDPAWLQALSDKTPESPLVDLLTGALSFYFDFHEQYGYGRIAQVHDAFAAMVAAGATPVSAEAYWVGVETTSELMRGTTVRDERHLLGHPPNARVVTGCDPQQVRETLLADLVQLADSLAARAAR